MAKHDFRSLAARMIDRGTKAGETDHPVDTFLADNGRMLNLAVTFIRPNPDQPRKHFDEAAHQELTASVRSMGVLQAITVRKDPANAGYIIISGERRWRAAKAAGVLKIPALVHDDQNTLEVALVENVQRENLNPIELAESLLKLREARSFSDGDLATVIGKSRPTVNELLSLNHLPETIREECRTSDKYSKSQLLEILRSGSTEAERLAVWDTLKGGEVATVRDLRSRTRPSRKRGFQRAYRAPGGQFRVVVAFRKADVSEEEIRAALQEAADHGA